jgi:predicted transcriptional regulator
MNPKKHDNRHIVTEILKHSESAGTERLIHLVLAANSQWATVAMPMKDIATQARISSRQAQRAVKVLMEQGYLTRTGGTGRGNVPRYHINVFPYEFEVFP